MVKHYIIMSSSYTDGARIALDITDTRLLSSQEIAKIIQDIKQSCGNDVPLSTHLIETGSNSWESVAEYDPFFEDVKCVRSVAEFSDKVKKGRVLTGLDVASFILSKMKCTHLSLEKLVYFAYADYLCEHSKRMFTDRIYAFKRGPVVESVYETYKRSGAQYVKSLDSGGDSDIQAGVKELPARSRILFAKDGAVKLRSIDKTVERYGGYAAGTLVEFTHRADSPWSHVDSSKPYQVISDELIAAHHHAECAP